MRADASAFVTAFDTEQREQLWKARKALYPTLYRFDPRKKPINFVDGDEPPMLLLQGTDDDEVPPHNAEAMAERAQAMDGTAHLKLYPHIGHSGILLAFARGRVGKAPALRDTLEFIAATPPAGP